MLRYLRLYLYFLRFSFSRAMEFRFDFFFRIGMDIIWNLFQITFFTLLFLKTGLLGGFDFDQTLVFAGTLFLVDAIQMSVFANNMWWFPILINKGDLDYYLVRPISPLFFLSVRDFAANSFVNLLISIGILIWALVRYPHPISLGSFGLYFGLLAVGIALQYLVYLAFLLPVFWIHSAGGMKETYFAVSSAANRPHRIFTGWARGILVSVLPFAFVVSFPVVALFEPVDGTLILHAAAVLAGAILVVSLAWRAGLRAYSSASS